ncbi:glycosyltransferase [Caballeronia sp. EK]|nr:glycosyltransferase [Caballeronia sp. EK]
MLRTVGQAIRVRGGPLPVARALLSVVRREGMHGVRRMIARAGRSDDYARWVRDFDSIDDTMRARLRAEAGALPIAPLISVIVPVFNTPQAFLRDMIESVRAQLYPHWELCICDDASTEAHVWPMLCDYARRDDRIKVMRRSANGHICAASNDACALASGEFIALLDHDDLLAEHALLMVVRYLSRHPDARMFFSDEDKLAADGSRIEPYFKSDWNPVLMLGQNMFSHLGVFQARLLRETGGFREGMEGSQDYDLALRCALCVDADQIVHIPHVLYHWRLDASSTAANVAAKPYARNAALRAVRDHLAQSGRKAQVEPLNDRSPMLRVRFDVLKPTPLVSILIPTRDRPDLLRQCVESIRAKTHYGSFEIILIDNGTNDPEALDLLREYEKAENTEVLRIDAPFNFSALNNAAAARAGGTVLCLMNNDIEVSDPDWLGTLCGYAMQPGAGAVGAALWYGDERLQHGGVVLAGNSVAGHLHHRLHRGDPGYFGRAVLAQEVSAVTAACLVVRKDRYDEVGGLDEVHLRVAYNDVDFCLKLTQAGYHNVYVPYAALFHHESATRGPDRDGARARRLEQEAHTMIGRWGDRLHSDPFYNSNLEINGGRFFALACPPRIGQFD